MRLTESQLQREIARKTAELETLEDLYKEVLEKHGPLKCNIYNARIELILGLYYLRACQNDGIN